MRRPTRCAAILASALVAGCATSGAEPPSTQIVPATMARIGVVDARYQSYNVELAEVIGGNFWKPYTPESIKALEAQAAAPAASGAASLGGPGQGGSLYQTRPPIELGNPRLRKLARALGPAYMRTSGTWMNSVYFHDSDAPAPSTAPQGFSGVLTRSQWKGVVDFAQAVDARLVISFAISEGVRDAAGVWTPVQAQPLLDYTKSIGGHIAAAEMFNEPDAAAMGGAPKGYDAARYAQDYAVFEPFIRAAVPDMLIAGPGSVGEGGPIAEAAGAALAPTTPQILAATPPPKFDVYSYHSYPAVSLRCVALGSVAQTTAADALSEQWLARADSIFDYYIALRDKFQPGSRGVWLTETADAACGGNPWAATFLDSFRYLDQLGRLAKQGATVSFHNTLASSEYGLLDQKTFEPRPNYWAALLWHRLMGPTVLDAGPSRPGLHRYAQCLAERPGGVAVLLINNSRTEPQTVELPMAAQRYTLSAPQLESGRVQLNGRELALGRDDALPPLQGTPVSAGRIELAPASITFFAFADAGNRDCP